VLPSSFAKSLFIFTIISYISSTCARACSSTHVKWTCPQ
jgi:hypothetical protein